jgi:hypothetical protein
MTLIGSVILEVPDPTRPDPTRPRPRPRRRRRNLIRINELR